MDFVIDLTITAGTTQDDPEEHTLPSFDGVIHLVEIEQPPGCGGEVYSAIRQGVHQVWPTNPQGAYRSDGRVYSTREHYRMKRGDPALVLQGWAPGAAYDHVVQFRISVLPVEILEPWRAQEGLLRRFLRAFGVK